MSALPEPPDDAEILRREFPSKTLVAQVPLWRVHRECNSTVYFATGQEGRFNPPTPDAGFGTWYLSTVPAGAFVETLGRFGVTTHGVLPRNLIDDRVLAEFYPASDLRVADLTDPRVVGRFGITNELSTASDQLYPLAQRWALRLWQSGFSGIHYAPRHDTELVSRSVALFGKPEDAALVEEQTRVVPLTELANELAEHFGFSIVSGRSL